MSLIPLKSLTLSVDCSGKSQLLPQYDAPVRVCDECYHTENYLRLNRFLKLSSKEADDEREIEEARRQAVAAVRAELALYLVSCDS